MGTIGESESISSGSIVEKALEGGFLGLWGLCIGSRGWGVRWFLEVDATGPLDRGGRVDRVGVLTPWELLRDP